jgi:PEP-CTERM motif
MSCKSFLIKPLAAVALIVMAGASQATITVYTSLAAFNAASSAPGTDTFAGFPLLDITPGPITRTAGPYSYTADAGPIGGFFGGGTAADTTLTTNSFGDTITFNGFTTGVAAIGGNFFGANIRGLFLPGDVTLTATDSSGSVARTITNATTSSFLGFVSTGSITSLTLCSVQLSLGRCSGPTDVTEAPFLWPALDNLVLAKTVAAIPEPSTYALLLAGLGAVGFVARRRRS